MADGTTFEEAFETGEASEPEETADVIVFAASREGSSLSEIDVNRRDKSVDSV